MHRPLLLVGWHASRNNSAVEDDIFEVGALEARLRRGVDKSLGNHMMGSDGPGERDRRRGRFGLPRRCRHRRDDAAAKKAGHAGVGVVNPSACVVS